MKAKFNLLFPDTYVSSIVKKSDNIVDVICNPAANTVASLLKPERKEIPLAGSANLYSRKTPDELVMTITPGA